LSERQRTGSVARNFTGKKVLTSCAAISSLGWFVFIEQPLDHAFKPLYASIFRTVLLLLMGIAMAVLASLLLARRMVKPIQTLREGATRVGSGELDHRIELRTGDELESLGEEFNRMAAKLTELENVRRLKRFFPPSFPITKSPIPDTLPYVPCAMPSAPSICPLTSKTISCY
jgi:methyl-accepting chemotaxis protein